MNITQTFPDDRPFMAIGHRYNYWKFLRFISTEGAGSTGPGDTQLSHFTVNYSNVSILPFFHPRFIVSYFNAFNTMENHNSMWWSYLVLDKYWVTYNGYFRLDTTVVLGMGIADENIIF